MVRVPPIQLDLLIRRDDRARLRQTRRTGAICQRLGSSRRGERATKLRARDFSRSATADPRELDGGSAKTGITKDHGRKPRLDAQTVGPSILGPRATIVAHPSVQLTHQSNELRRITSLVHGLGARTPDLTCGPRMCR